MPRFPFSSYLRFRRFRRLSGFRIFERLASVSLPRIQSTYSPIFRKISSAGNDRSYPLAFVLSPNGDALYVPVADSLATRRYISFHDLLPSHDVFLCTDFFADEIQTFFHRLVSYDEEETLRCNDGRCNYANLGRFDGSIRCSR